MDKYLLRAMLAFIYYYYQHLRPIDLIVSCNISKKKNNPSDYSTQKCSVTMGNVRFQVIVMLNRESESLCAPILMRQRFIFTDAVHETACSASARCNRRPFTCKLFNLLQKCIMYPRMCGQFNSILPRCFVYSRNPFAFQIERCAIIDFLIDGSMTTHRTQRQTVQIC